MNSSVQSITIRVLKPAQLLSSQNFVSYSLKQFGMVSSTVSLDGQTGKALNLLSKKIIHVLTILEIVLTFTPYKSASTCSCSPLLSLTMVRKNSSSAFSSAVLPRVFSSCGGRSP